MRFIADADGRVVLDLHASAAGRGAWVHPNRTCVTTAVRRHAAERSLKVAVGQGLDPKEVLRGLRTAVVRKAESLMLVASRTRRVALGAEAVSGWLDAGTSRLVVLASDAGGTARELASSGNVRVVTFQTKSELGRLFRRKEVAVVALSDLRIAAELASTIDCFAGLEDR